MHAILLPTLLFVLNFFALAPRPWTAVDEAPIEKIAREHGSEARCSLLKTGHGDLLLFVIVAAGIVAGFGAGYWWRMRSSEKKDVKGSLNTL